MRSPVWCFLSPKTRIIPAALSTVTTTPNRPLLFLPPLCLQCPSDGSRESHLLCSFRFRVGPHRPLQSSARSLFPDLHPTAEPRLISSFRQLRFCRLVVNGLTVNPNVALLGFTKKLFTPTYHCCTHRKQLRPPKWP